MIDAKELARIFRTPLGKLTPNEIEAALRAPAGDYTKSEMRRITGIVPMQAKPGKPRAMAKRVSG